MTSFYKIPLSRLGAFFLLCCLATKTMGQRELEPFIPYGETSLITHPIIEIRTVVHVIKRDEQVAENITEDSTAYLKQQFDWINRFYREMEQPILPTLDGIVHYVPDSRIRFYVDTVLFHVSTEDWDRIYTDEEQDNLLSFLELRNGGTELVVSGKWRSRMFRAEDSLKVELLSGDNVILRYSQIVEEGNTTVFKLKETTALEDSVLKISYFRETNNNCSLDLWEKHAQSSKNALHVFYSGSSKLGNAFGCGPTPYFLNVSNIIKGGDWAGAQLTAHELGHTLGLRHTDTPQFDDLPKKDKFGFIACNATETSNNIMGYNVCRNYLSPKQIGYVHQLYSTKPDRILLTRANEYVSDNPIEIWDSTHWDKAVLVRNDIIIRKGQKLVVTGQIHMAAGATIYVEKKASLVVEDAVITNVFGTSWQGVVLCKSYERSHKIPRKKKNYGVIILQNGSIENAIRINSETLH